MTHRRLGARVIKLLHRGTRKVVPRAVARALHAQRRLRERRSAGVLPVLTAPAAGCGRCATTRPLSTITTRATSAREGLDPCQPPPSSHPGRDHRQHRARIRAFLGARRRAEGRRRHLSRRQLAQRATSAAAQRLAAQGYAVYALDLRGRGRSTGERFYIERFQDDTTHVDATMRLA